MSLAPETAAQVARCAQLLQTQNHGFLESVRQLENHEAATEVAELWQADKSDWARRQLLTYLKSPLEAFGHEPLIKRLFKHAEASNDHELMSAFLVAFDKIVRRDWKQSWDYSNIEPGEPPEVVERLVAPRNRMPLRKTVSWTVGKRVLQYPAHIPKNARLFTYSTRYYLRRRAWRYFRQLGHQRPDEYVAAVCFALAGFCDADLSNGESILDCWGLMHIAFGQEPSVSFTASRVVLKPGARISELASAPAFPELWRQPSVFDHLATLLTAAHSHLVRRWATGLARSEHAEQLQKLPLANIIRLLRSSDPSISGLGAELLPAAADREELTLSQWLELLPEDNPVLASQLCEMIAERIRSEDVSKGSAIDLALQRDPSIARLGLTLLQRTDLAATVDIAQLSQLVRLAQAQCDTAIPLIVRFAVVGITRIADANSKTPAGSRDAMRDSVLAFFESTRESTRSAALEWLESHIEHPLIANHAEFWRHALETPYDDLRLRLVSLLDRVEQPGSISLAQHDAWRQVLVNIHRGTRLKPFVIARLQEAIAASPETADANLRALALAARSVRAPERRAALTALVQLFAAEPEVRLWIEREVPELKVSLAGEEIASDEHAIK